MGLFDLFRSDPRQLLTNAEEALNEGDAKRALKLAQKAAKGTALAQQSQADALIRQAREALAEEALAKADISEESGFPADAAEWIRIALDTVDDDAQRQQLQERSTELLKRAERDDEPPIVRDEEAWEEAVASERDAIPELDEPEGHDLDAESYYLTLVDMLDDDVAARYEERPEAFRSAYLALNEGRPEEARPLLEELAASASDDPVYRLERGRCRLLLEEHEGAREDLEAVWETFGDEPIDRAGSMSIPGLWAEAMLGLGRANELVDRLDEVADPREGDAELCNRFALGLILAGRFEEARNYLERAMGFFPQNPAFPYHMAAVLRQLDQRPAAINVLESSIAPSCASGHCGPKPPKHAPSLRALVGLYLDTEPGRGPGLERARELLTLLSQAQGGQLAAEDYLLLAEYHHQNGDPDAAQEAAAEARQRKSAGDDAMATSLPELSGPSTSRAAL